MNMIKQNSQAPRTDYLGYPLDEQGALLKPEHLRLTPRSAAAAAAKEALGPTRSFQAGQLSSRARRTNYINDNIQSVKNYLPIKHKMPPKVHIRAPLPEEVFGKNYQEKKFKSKMQQSAEASQRFVATFRDAVHQAREEARPIGNTSRDVYGPNFRAIWYPVLQPQPEKTAPVRHSFEASGGYRNKRRLNRLYGKGKFSNSTGSKSRPGVYAGASGTDSKGPKSAVHSIPDASQEFAEQWQDAISTSEKSSDSGSQQEYSVGKKMTQKDATRLLWCFFDKVIRVGHDLRELKNALRVCDSETVGYISWTAFVAVLEGHHWQLSDKQLHMLQSFLTATRMLRKGRTVDVVDYMAFVLGMRSWQHQRQNALKNGNQPAPEKIMSKKVHAQVLAGSRKRFAPRSKKSLGLAVRQQAVARRNKLKVKPRSNASLRRPRSRSNVNVSIVDKAYKIDPVLEAMLTPPS